MHVPSYFFRRLERFLSGIVSYELSAIYAACFLFFLINSAGLISTDALLTNWLNSSALSQKARQIMLLEKSYQAPNVAEVFNAGVLNNEN